MPRVLVTGAGGWIGREVVRVLAGDGAEVFGLGRAEWPPNLHLRGWFRADLLKEGAAQALRDSEAETLIHLAWVTEHGRFWAAPENKDWVRATTALGRAAAAQGIRRFIGVGTCAEYDPHDEEPRNERFSSIAPSTLYGRAKHEARRALELICKEAGISFSWARVFFPYGGNEPMVKLIPSLASAFLSGQPALMGSGQAMRDYIHVCDAAEAIARLALSNVEGPVNIGTGEAISLRRIGECLAECAGRPDLLRVGGRPDPAGEASFLVADAGRLRREVGFKPRLDLESGLALALEHWRTRAESQ